MNQITQKTHTRLNETLQTVRLLHWLIASNIQVGLIGFADVPLLAQQCALYFQVWPKNLRVLQQVPAANVSDSSALFFDTY